MDDQIPIISTIKIREFSEIQQLRNPVCIHGMPGMGMTGKTAIDYYIKELKPSPQKIFEIYSTAFPSNVIIEETGLISPPKIAIYIYKNENIKREHDIIFITGDTQPTSVIGTNNLSSHLVKIMHDLNVKILISLAATPVNIPKPTPKVYITVTSTEILEGFKKLGVKGPFIRGIITGMNGIIPGLAKFEYGIEGCALLAETYPQYGKDISASISLINILNKYLNLEISTLELEENAKKIENMYNSLMEQQKRRQDKEKKKDLGYIC